MKKMTQTASHWGVFNVETANGEILGTTPFSRDPRPASYVGSLPETVRHELRIERPHVRESYLRHREKAPRNRGGEAFVPVSWEVALDLIEDELRRVKDRYGNEAIYGGSYGWASAGRLHHSPSVLKRFLGLHGGYVDKAGNHSFGAAAHIMPYVIGDRDVPSQSVPFSEMIEHTKLFIMFGGTALKNSQIDAGGTVLHTVDACFAAAKARGIRFVNISPSRDDAAASLGAEWLPIRPNTDTAFMLGLAHTIVAEDRHDRAFLARYCVGFERFENYLLGRTDGVPKDASWAAALTGISASTIADLARRMAETRTLINTSWSVQRADHGEQPVWMTVTLAAILGKIGLPGGGFSLGLGATNSIGMTCLDIPRPKLPLGPNPIRTHVPVGRVAEMLLNPGTELQYNGKALKLPDIKLIYSVGGNPFHHNANLNRFVEAWQRPDTIIVHEPWWTPPARFADIVLPATTTMERNDILATERTSFYIAMHKVIEPVGQSRNDFDVFAELSARLGFHDAYTCGRNEMGWLRHMYEEARKIAQERGYSPPPFDTFWAEGSYEFPSLQQDETFLGAFRSDPETNRLDTQSGKIELTSALIESFNYDDCPAHATWIEPAEWLGSGKADKYPIHLLSHQPSVRLHSQLDMSPVSRASKLNGREPISLSYEDASARGLTEGDLVRVYNDRGAFIAAVKIVDSLRPGVAQMATGAWYDPSEPGKVGSLEKHGNPNVVTDDRGTSQLAQGSIAQTVLVEIEKCMVAPPVTAFDLPTITELPPPPLDIGSR
ncbi:molybdopterin-dependent oxidoreductase [Rhodopseudomonas sp. P2A-2r]|uniref:molybdopterin-dependent oxidoreductase n=1 Tax=Rhodopseudomonas sp. P2A-2r TaxID=2991972 RepID=UPI002234E344|nr:molybdopterin-dependent oxidoreductase [Rhodopseudomonas sp. P2A-2r]UZE50693.1 molybdopterin-dependent oxidoreductase [Rhodopseudomonas sp. P2A-2r]